jgi:hypothetical protein
MAPTDLELRARRAYELGRLRHASWLLLPVALLAALALLIGRPPPLVAAVSALLACAAIGLAFARTEHHRAALAGLVAALPPLLLPFAVRAFGQVCTGEPCSNWCLPACLGGGALAGVLIGLRAAGLSRGRWSFCAVALLVAALGGSVGCTLAGGAGVVGMLAGLAAGSAPLMLRTSPS